ncbi:MAG TPA: tandem-95 repeat protein [Methanosarcinales archaeon]|nr:tandem-95 repeat protein [Methanosarcinales archaeon]
MPHKNILLSVIVITILMLSAGVVWADDETYTDVSDSVVKWRQPPDMDYGVNIRSIEVEPVVADDWKCVDPRPLTDVHFWGSYIGWEAENPNPPLTLPMVRGFVIRIYEDVPAGVDTDIPWSRPGALLYETKLVEFEEMYVASIKHPDGYEHKFYYSLDLPEPFDQIEGTIYWISIAAVMPEEYKYPWGWETSNSHWNDDACRYWSDNNYWEEIAPKMLPSWYQEHYRTVDMAFELTVPSETPEPLEPIKWQQRPDMVRGINVISIPTEEKRITVADDWLCLDGSPVTDLHFWGSYPGWKEDVETPPGDPPGVEKFRIQIYSDAPSTTPDEFSRPDKLLYEVWVDDFTETYVASILSPWESYEHKYRYDLDLPEVFRQKRDRIYWLSIAAVPRDPEFPWGWESSMDRWNDFAVQGWYTDPDDSEWELIMHPWTKQPIDMAFELTTSEGPIKWLQFPDMADGVNILSLPEDPVVADDWLCTDGKAVTEVHFWGSYLSIEGERHWEQDNPGPPEKLLPQTPGVSGFKLSFHNDVPAGVDPDMPWSHPGELLREVWVDSDNVKERYWDSVPHTDVAGTIWWEHKFYYIVRLEEPFEQEEGRIYWLDIGAKPAEEKWFWGWETSKDHWNDNAVRGLEGGEWWEELDHSSEKQIDMAFMLISEQFFGLDFGDAPDPRYPTLVINNGACHTINPGICLGRWVEADVDGQPSISATGDDFTDGTDDEDGVAIPPFRAGATTRIQVTSSVTGYLNAWFDWNADGDWDDPGEYVISDLPIPAGPSAHGIHVPGDAKPGSSYARFRFSTIPLASVLPAPLYEGRAQDGEVEDHKFLIQQAGPDHFEPNDDFATALDLGCLNQDRSGLGIHEQSDEDWFEWAALNDGPVNFNANFDGQIGSLKLELYDSEENLLATSETGAGSEHIKWDTLAGESYFVRVCAADIGMIMADYGLVVELLGESDNYALLFSGGAGPGSNHARYYNNIKEMYETLVDDYDLAPDNIWVLYADGTDPAVDRSDGINSDMSYAINGTTVLPGTRANLQSVLTTTLAARVDGNDHLLFYAFDHGGGTSNAPATTGEEVLTGWGDSTADNDLEDWLNQAGAGHTTVVHTQCFAGGMLDDLLPLTTSAFGCAATNHYESSWGDGFAGAFADALNLGYENTHDAYVYAHDHDPYAFTRGTYPDNEGTYTWGKEHPWAASDANFPIFAGGYNWPPIIIEKYRVMRFVPPWEPVIITHDMLLAQAIHWEPDVPGATYFRIETVESGSLIKDGVPVVPGETMLRYGDSVVWTPPAIMNAAEEASAFNAFTIRAVDMATVSDHRAMISIVMKSEKVEAVDDVIEIDEDDQNVAIDVLANDSGEGALVVTGVGQPQHGATSLVQGKVIYTPGPNFHGSDQFTYSMTDSAQNTDMATVTVRVRSINDPPEAYDDQLTVAMDSANNRIDVLVNDYDVDPDPLTALPGSSPVHGSVTQNADGTFSYTPDAGYTGPDSFTYFAYDGMARSMADVMITVQEKADSDWGDAPEFPNSLSGGYPTRAIRGGASHAIGTARAPRLGATMPDVEADGQPHPVALGDDSNNIDDEDGVFLPILQQGQPASIEIEVNGGGGYVDAWIDWNGNHLWEHPQEQIHSGYLSDGKNTVTTTVPDTATPDQTFARFRISSKGGLTPRGPAPDGEVEDYEVWIQAQPHNTKWVQLPDLTPNGIDIRVDEMRTIADDFECISPSLLTDVHFWGSWKYDEKGEIRNIRLSIHSDDPAGAGGSDPYNRFSKPDKLLWERDFGPDEFKEMLYYVMPVDPGEWWWDPASGELIKGGDTQVWRYDIQIKPDEAFQQMGTVENPIIYWLDISVKTEQGEFGWKTREWPRHFMDDAVWDRGSELPRIWKELRYPPEHPYHGLERDSIDMAFMLTFEELDWGDAPDGATAPGYPTLSSSNGARHVIVPGFYLGPTVRVSQESSPGAGDFDANILGYVSPYATNLSTSGYYQYGTPYGASFNGPAPTLTSDRSHLFLADTTDGLSLFVVHDKPVDGSGGNTTMHWTLAGDTAGVLALDDPGESVTVSGGGTIFDSRHRWWPCCTDGMAFGSLDGAWTMIGEFTNAIAETGMDEWRMHSSDNSSIALSFETNRRVRLDYHDAIDPEPDGQPDSNALGDDNDGNDDENGVVFNTPLVAGKPATVTVTASAPGLLQGWIDFNADRSWADPGEQIFANQPLVTGPNVLNFSVPAATIPGSMFARFRFSKLQSLSFEGLAPDGEVEDYKVWIVCDPGIDVEKKVMDPETGEWVDAITAEIGDLVRFNCTIHNNGTCCDLTEIMVTDVLSESLEYADNATVDPAFVGIRTVVWKFPDRILKPCKTITIEFDARVIRCGIDVNTQEVKAVCAETGEVVYDEDIATVMAGRPKLEWTWNSTTVEPNYNQVMMAPVAADLNGDGIPDIIFSTFNRSWLAGGIIRAISGDDGSELFSVTDPEYRVQAGAEPAVADIDDDGMPEILVSKNSSEIICFEHDGSFKWNSTTRVGRLAVAVADLDQDGTPEIIAGRTVFNNDGTVRWTGTAGSSYASAVADLDDDGMPEVVTGSAAYRYNGSIYWTSSPAGRPAIGNFDSDPYPEIVVVGGDNVSLKEHDGTLKWGPVAMPARGNGPPVVADIDGDGELEIGVGGYDYYVAFETDGSIKWMAEIRDHSSRAAGSSAFDFDSDGSCEIIYSDELYHRIFRGSDGAVLFKTPGPSGTLIEQPVIVDVDSDGHVEIVFAVNNYAFAGNTGIEVYGNDECWPEARCIWNQHTYHITNVNDDATVPAVETNNWDVYNNYRAQTPESCGEVDVTIVNITPPSQNVYPGSFTVNVTVDPAEPIAGVQFDLSFDASLVSAESVTEGDLLNQDGASTHFSPGTIDNTTGTIAGVAGVITTPGATVSAPGVFATIQMTAKSVGGTSPLDLSSVIVGDINGTAVSIMVNDGTVTITTCIGDVNGDGNVNVLDMIRVGQHWGETGTPGWIPEDVNKDGEINVLDMIVIGQHWGPCP